jgi:hypothetical protein
MSIELGRSPYSLRKLAVLAAGLGLLLVAGIGGSSAEAPTSSGGADCPQWTSPVCRAWSLGPPPRCTDYACVADKQSDPPKRAAIRGVLSTGPGLLEQGGGGFTPGGPAATGSPMAPRAPAAPVQVIK